MANTERGNNRSKSRFRSFKIAILCLLFGALASGHNSRAAERERFLAGQLLVATAEMKDPRFAESVIYMVKHDVTGDICKSPFLRRVASTP